MRLNFRCDLGEQRLRFRGLALADHLQCIGKGSVHAHAADKGALLHLPAGVLRQHLHGELRKRFHQLACVLLFLVFLCDLADALEIRLRVAGHLLPDALQKFIDSHGEQCPPFFMLYLSCGDMLLHKITGDAQHCL